MYSMPGVYTVVLLAIDDMNRRKLLTIINVNAQVNLTHKLLLTKSGLFTLLLILMICHLNYEL